MAFPFMNYVTMAPLNKKSSNVRTKWYQILKQIAAKKVITAIRIHYGDMY